MRNLLIPKIVRRKIWHNFLILNAILWLFPLFVYFNMVLFTHSFQTFLLGMYIFFIIYFVGVGSFLWGYFSTPSKIASINDSGFCYLPLFGGKKNVSWSSVKSFKYVPALNYGSIHYKNLIGIKRIVVDRNTWEKLRKAWEEWKKEQAKYEQKNLRK